MDARTPRALTVIRHMTPIGFILLAIGNGLAKEPEVITFHHDAGWCWFDDERAIVHDQVLFIATVADGRNPDGSVDRKRRGHIEVTRYDLASKRHQGTAALHENLEADDHNSPAILAQPDGRILAVYPRNDATALWETSRPKHFSINASNSENTPKLTMRSV